MVPQRLLAFLQSHGVICEHPYFRYAIRDTQRSRFCGIVDTTEKPPPASKLDFFQHLTGDFVLDPVARGQAVGILLTLDQLSEPLVADVLNDRLPSSESESAIPVASEKYSAQTKKQSLTRGTNSQDIVIVQHRNEGGWIWLSHRRDFALTRIHANIGYVMRFRIAPPCCGGARIATL